MASNKKNVDEEFSFDMDFEEDDDDEVVGAPAWLSSYSDMMTDLMAIFVVLFSFAMMATSQQNFKIKNQMEKLQSDAQVSTTSELSSEDVVANMQAQQDLDMVYESILKKIKESGYADSIALKKGEGYILFRFKDSVLFYPDSPIMRESSFDILKYMGDLLLGVENSIGAIEISGHTAKISEYSSDNFFSWELSSDRAISVLTFFARQCDLPQIKMVVSGYSHQLPVADNSTEEGRALNRRVEVKINRIDSSQKNIIK